MSRESDFAAGRKVLFSPIEIGALMLRNRIVMSPMTRRQASAGVLFQSDYYVKRAQGGCGLIITEGVAIDHAVADYTTECPQIGGPEQVAAWADVAARVHVAGAPIVMQLWHTGIRRPTPESFRPELPSASPSGTYPTGQWPHRYEPATDAEIEAIIDAYARSAALAKSAGLDGVEIHAGHGYLPDQFFWTETNIRTDRWGGDIAGRVRFAEEVIKAIKRAAGSDYPVFLRFSQWKLDSYESRLADTPQILARYLEPLADAGVDVFDASTRRFWEPEFEGSDLNLAGWARKITGKPAMTVGSVGLEGPLEANARLRKQAEAEAAFGGLDPLYERLGRGDFDLVGVGRALLANEDWANIIREERFADLHTYTSETSYRALI
jgi:2,4-dienoyl-CoA reductase-like NADH-dependent reductase (Old Yellow Enzyme family)